MNPRWFIVPVAAMLLTACGSSQGEGSQIPKDIPEPTPSCVACDAGYHCATDDPPRCVAD